MRQLLRYWPPRIVSAKWTRQLSRSSTLPIAAAIAAFGHHRVRLAEQRLADEPDAHALRRGFDRRAQAGAAGADDEHVVLDRLILGAHRAAPMTALNVAEGETLAGRVGTLAGRVGTIEHTNDTNERECARIVRSKDTVSSQPSIS